ncbi:MAG: T9SS type A sorting domain-containing protein [Flavobacteriaceae bacterium]|nr:T9SS type A sorting domain-containing protein [Flavobacteriaceae bacterium]
MVYIPFRGNTNDSSVYSFSTTNMGSPSYSAGHDKDSNSAVCFNGSSQYIRVGDILDSVFCRTVAKFSVGGWFNTASLPAAGNASFIVAKAAGGNGPYQWYVMLWDDGTLRGTLHSTPSTSNLGTAGWLSMKSNKSVVPGNWYKFTFVVDGSLSDSNRVKLFLDGEKGSFASSNGTWGTTSVNTDQELTIGAGHAPINPFAPNNQFDGCIDDILILNRAMADSELVLPNSIGHNISMSKVDVYPNPTDDNIFIQFNKTKVSKITLFDNAGKAVYLNNNISKADQLTINIEHLAKGIYHLNLLSDESSTTKKIVVY